MIRKLITIVAPLIILALGAGGIAFMNSLKPKIESAAPETTPPSVFFTVAAVGPKTLDVYAQGEVRPRTDINLTAQVAGQIVSMSSAFVNGGAFEGGDILIRIEDAPYRATAAAARSRLAQEEAEAALARRDYEDLARAEGPTELALRIPQLEQARSEYRAAQLDLERTTIRARFKGRVRERIVGLGQFVSPGAQLGRIFSTDAAEIRLPLTDNDLAKLGLPVAFVETRGNPGPSVVLSASIAGERHEWAARMVRTNGAIDPTTRQISAIAVVDDPYGRGASTDGAPLAMGLFVDAKIEGSRLDNAIVLPRAALHDRDAVYVIGPDDVIERRKVQVVSSDMGTFTIASGLAAGDRIVTSPLRGAGDGDKVTPAQTTTTEPDRDSNAHADLSDAAGPDR